MSAVCALYRFDEQPVDGASVAPMMGALESWGEGPVGTWIDPEGRAGLGCRQMRVTPEDAFDVQPLAQNDSAVLVADARIDNRPELAAELGVSPADAACMSDSAFILAAWSAFGEACVDRLIGDFVFVIHDRRNGRLFCARDPLGQRVLFMHRNAHRIALASAVPALLALPDVPVRLDEQKIAELLVLMEDARTTCFEGVHRLLPGHTLTVDRTGAAGRRYWRPDLTKRTVLGSDEEYLEAFRVLWRRAIQDRIRSTRPVAIMVSAGLDSSAVAGMAAEVLRESGRRLLAWHAAPHELFRGEARQGWINDESDDVRALASMHANMDLDVLRGQEGTPLDDAVWLFEALHAPVRNSINLTWFRKIYELAAARGAGVMLHGGKGNLTISYTGLRSIQDEARRGHLVHAVREATAVARARGHRPLAVIKDQILRPLLPLPARRVWSRLRNARPAPIWDVNLSAIRPEFARNRRLDALARERRSDDTSLERMSAAAFRYHVLGLAADGFDMAHVMRSRFPIETREATTDLRVLEFCMSIPGSVYLREGRDRLLIRRAMRGIVPNAILERTTRGAQAADWPRWFDEMRPALQSEVRALAGVDLARRSLDLERMQGLLDGWPARLGPEHLGEYGMRLLRGVMMGRFIRWFEERWG